MLSRSQIFFKQFEYPIQVTNFLSITGKKEHICDFLETQLFNGERKIEKSLSKFDINTMSLRNYKFNNDKQDNPIMILCDEAYITKGNKNLWNIQVNFFTINGLRQQLISDLSYIYQELTFNNNFFNIENDYCGNSVFKYGEANYFSYDSFHERFGCSLHAMNFNTTVNIKNFTIEIPVSTVRHINPFNFDLEPIKDIYSLHFSLISIDLLEVIISSFKNPSLHQEFLEKVENSPFKMLRYLRKSGFKITFSNSDEAPFSLTEDKTRGLAYFFNIIQFYIEHRDFLQTCYTSLLLEKSYQEKKHLATAN